MFAGVPGSIPGWGVCDFSLSVKASLHIFPFPFPSLSLSLRPFTCASKRTLCISPISSKNFCLYAYIGVGHNTAYSRVFPRPVSTCVPRPLPRPKGEPARGVRGMLPRKILKFDVAKTAILGIFMHLAAHFSSLPLPKNESDSEYLPKTLIEDKSFHIKLCRAELPIDNENWLDS